MAADAKHKEEVKVLLRNKKARHDYFVEWTVEAGVALLGSEVKSLREAKAVMSDAYATVKNGEAWLINMQVTEYPWANRWNHAPKRDRKLLLHRREIDKLDDAASQAGLYAACRSRSISSRAKSRCCSASARERSSTTSVRIRRRRTRRARSRRRFGGSAESASTIRPTLWRS